MLTGDWGGTTLCFLLGLVYRKVKHRKKIVWALVVSPPPGLFKDRIGKHLPRVISSHTDIGERRQQGNRQSFGLGFFLYYFYLTTSFLLFVDILN